MTYNPWPLGALPPEFIRPEIKELHESGYVFHDPRDIIGIFESRLAEFSGAKYAVVLDCASHGIFLSLKFKKVGGIVEIPANTYISVAMQIIHAGAQVKLVRKNWSGLYELGNTKIYDSAARFTKGMYVGSNSLQVLSFQIKKRLPIGRGGAVLTDDKVAYDWLKKASYDGRDLMTPYDAPDHVSMLGWHMYMTPEDAARGLILMDKLGDNTFSDIATHESYPDITDWVARIDSTVEQK
jgi:dTDP-4-amino-4,6-dideoxygalactose transaminase